ncbi:hypothetical protein LDG_6619 [Legionella drancourtii LLAP12]|uniref:Uncharacterized protein n=2 Tax=Legionella drancourtii TaxID=168933 RepID=G9EMZ9_9GAMM|nr:hypothetical protein LDG_6619 [Legionella drancourtii LLAP12]
MRALINYAYKEGLYGDDFMNDPFSALKDALQSVFHLEAMRSGKYIYPEIQQLKLSLDNFQPNNKRSFIELLKGIRATLPRIEKYIEKGHINFNAIKTSIDSLAKTLNLPLTNWDNYLSHSNLSPKFQFNDTRKELGLLPWLVAKAGKTSTRHNANTQISLLLEYRDHFGFSQKLSAHLKKDPEFLFRLIMESDNNFAHIAHTRLVLYLTDQQLAEAIIKHIPHFVQNNANPTAQAAKLVDKLNEILSNGRSVSTLLRNAEAKFILDSSELLQIYQNGEAEQGHVLAAATPPSSHEDGGLKPTL